MTQALYAHMNNKTIKKNHMSAEKKGTCLLFIIFLHGLQLRFETLVS
jgi:hypothetical protein